jgi:molecular chaperone GrpE
MARKHGEAKQAANPAPVEDGLQDGTVAPEASDERAPAEGVDDAADAISESAPGAELVEPSTEAVKRLESELEALNDRYLRLAAEFDNYRKRVARDRTELRERSQAELLRDVLEALDDLGRVTDMTAEHANVTDVIQGVEMVERKLLDELTRAGIQRLGEQGEVFNPHEHEAVGSLPTPEASLDGRVAEVLQVGYRFGSALLRPARVIVNVASAAASAGDGSVEAGD